MITNNLRKTVASLGEAKHRRELGLFKAEGAKCVTDTLSHFDLEYLFATDRFLSVHENFRRFPQTEQATRADLDRMSSLSTPTDVIAVYRIPQYELDIPSLSGNLSLALDSIQDPGNLGTIMRTADWFGVRDILCSQSTVDLFNPKTVQATMGAISRVRVHYCDLPSVLSEAAKSGLPLYGTFLEGVNIYHADLRQTGIIVMGNEGRGVSPEVASLLSNKLFIPPYGAGETSESLNVAIATAVTLAEFRRRQ